MALRAVPEHPKFARLKSTLKLPKGGALGWLEAMWHFAGKFTPHGNIGKYADAEIEAWVEWCGEPGELVRALVDSGWVDASTQHRLIVHDWHIHADNATKLAVKRSGKPFVSDSVSTVSPRCSDKVEEVATPLGLPVPEPVPVPVPDPVITPEMVASGVMTELCISTRDLAVTLDGVCRAEMKKGRDATELRDALIGAYQEWDAAKPRLNFAKSTKNFFGEGDWRNRTGWPWKPGQSPPTRKQHQGEDPALRAIRERKEALERERSES